LLISTTVYAGDVKEIEFPVILSDTNGHMVKLVDKNPGTSISLFEHESYKGAKQTTNISIDVFNSYTNKGYTISTNAYAMKLLGKNKITIVYDQKELNARHELAGAQQRSYFQRVADHNLVLKKQAEIRAQNAARDRKVRDKYVRLNDGTLYEWYSDGWGNSWVLRDGVIESHSGK